MVVHAEALMYLVASLQFAIYGRLHPEQTFFGKVCLFAAILFGGLSILTGLGALLERIVS